MERDYEANLQTLWYVLRHRLFLIIVITLVCALLTAAFSIYILTPVYSSTAKFYAYNNAHTQSSITNQDISAAQSLVGTYIVVLTGDTALQKIAAVAEVSYTPGQLRGMISAGSISGTEVFKITVSNKSPAEALRIAEAFVTVVPDEIERVVNAGGVKIMDNPKLAISPDSPNVIKNTVIGGVIGAVISFAIFFLKEVLDVTIYTEEDIRRAVSYPIIGLIPTFNTDEEIAAAKKKVKKRKKSSGYDSYDSSSGNTSYSDTSF